MRRALPEAEVDPEAVLGHSRIQGEAIISIGASDEGFSSRLRRAIMATMLAFSRHLGFVALNGALASATCFVLWQGLPFLANEPGSLLFWPMTLISLVTFALLYPILKRQRSPWFRAPLFYLAFLASLVSYGGYLWLIVPHGTAMMIPLALVAGHLYGLPLLVVIWLVNTALAPLLFRQPDVVP